MNSINKIIFFILPFIILSGCNKNLSPVKHAEISLELEHAEVTEVWLNLNIGNSKSAQNYVVERNGEQVFQGNIVGDSLLIDEGLLPKHTYNYIAYLYNGRKTNPTEPIKVTTQDTTSHNFTWTIDTLGRYASYFNDVTIIDENNIWAYGEIRTDSGYYGAAHWDGVEWKLERLFWNSSNVYGIQSIWGESADDFWVAVGSIFHWNGSVLEMKYQVLGTQKGLRSVWGTDNSNLYFAGNGGNIVHYDGSHFKQMISGTDIDLKRISGNDKGNVFITGYEDDGQGIALKLNNNTWQKMYVSPSGGAHIPSGNYGRFKDVFCGNNFVYFLTTAGLLKVNLKSSINKLITERDFGSNEFVMHDIEGQAENDFIIASNRGRIVHWNGYSWSIQNEMYDLYPDHILTVYGADYNDNTVAIVGTYSSGSKGLIIIGKQY